VVVMVTVIECEREKRMRATHHTDGGVRVLHFFL